MLHITRRLLAGPLLVAAIGAGLVAVPGAAHAAGVTATVQVGSTLRMRAAPALSATIVGTVIRTIPHGTGQAGVVASFVMLKK